MFTQKQNSSIEHRRRRSDDLVENMKLPYVIAPAGTATCLFSEQIGWIPVDYQLGA